MVVIFNKIYLRDLYEKGECKDKKHRFQHNVIKGYIKGINFLKGAARKEDLFQIRSLNFEKLSGDKKNLYSIRVDRKYRIEFYIEEINEETIYTVCNIEELSNHYE